MSIKRAICVMAIGEKYQRLLEKSRHMFQWYANRSSADFIIFNEPLDPSMKHNFLMQKMLFPSKVIEYEETVLMDLDILISPLAKNIFDCFDYSFALSATVDQIDSIAYKNVSLRLWNKPVLLSQTHHDYFKNAGFTHFPAETFFGSINGGVYLARPSLVAEKLHDLYFNFESKYSLSPIATHHEEYLMAYEAQKEKLFYELPIEFNFQILYELYGTDLYFKIPGFRDNLAKKILSKIVFSNSLKTFFSKEAYQHSKLYFKAIESLLRSNSILHFAGGYHIPEQFYNLERYKN